MGVYIERQAPTIFNREDSILKTAINVLFFTILVSVACGSNFDYTVLLTHCKLECLGKVYFIGAYAIKNINQHQRAELAIAFFSVGGRYEI